MSCVPTGRVGLTPDVSGFVVNEDLGPRARLQRAARLSRVRVRAAIGQATSNARGWTLRGLGTVRCTVVSGVARLLAPLARNSHPQGEPAQVPDLPPVQTGVPRAATINPLARRLRIAAAAAIIRGNQMTIIILERLRPNDRLHDLAALLLVVLRWSLRRLLMLPRSLQAAMLAGVGLWLAPWPDMPVKAAPEVSLAMAVAPVEAPREPDLWKQVPGAIAAWHLEAPEIDRSVMKYRARRQANGARQDMLSWFEETGDDGVRPANRVSGALAIEHYPGDPPKAESLFMDAARRAALVGAGIDKMSDAYRIHNKFGAFEIADTVLSGPSGARKCLVFRHVAETVPLQLHGWFCAAPQRTLDRATLACLLDRVDMIGGSGAPVRAWFAKVERSRKACGTYPVAVAPAGWVDANGRVPDLKSAIRESRRM